MNKKSYIIFAIFLITSCNLFNDDKIESWSIQGVWQVISNTGILPETPDTSSSSFQNFVPMDTINWFVPPDSLGRHELYFGFAQWNFIFRNDSNYDQRIHKYKENSCEPSLEENLETKCVKDSTYNLFTYYYRKYALENDSLIFPDNYVRSTKISKCSYCPDTIIINQFQTLKNDFGNKYPRLIEIIKMVR